VFLLLSPATGFVLPGPFSRLFPSHLKRGRARSDSLSGERTIPPLCELSTFFCNPVKSTVFVLLPFALGKYLRLWLLSRLRPLPTLFGPPHVYVRLRCPHNFSSTIFLLFIIVSLGAILFFAFPVTMPPRVIASAVQTTALPLIDSLVVLPLPPARVRFSALTVKAYFIFPPWQERITGRPT